MDRLPDQGSNQDLRIDIPSHLDLILLFYQLLIASAQPHYRSRMRCNASTCESALLRLCLGRDLAEALVGVAKPAVMGFLEMESFEHQPVYSCNRRGSRQRLLESSFANDNW
jgi:hypothetical protein